MIPLVRGTWTSWSTEAGSWGGRGWGADRTDSCCSTGAGVRLGMLDDSGDAGGDGCSAALMYFTPVNCTLTNKMVNLTFCLFHHNLENHLSGLPWEGGLVSVPPGLAQSSSDTGGTGRVFLIAESEDGYHYSILPIPLYA